MPKRRKPEIGRDYVIRNGTAYYTQAYVDTLGKCCNKVCGGCPWKMIDPGPCPADAPSPKTESLARSRE